MRYSKTHVNEIIDKVVKATYQYKYITEFLPQLELIKEEHLLIDRRLSSLPEYATDVVRDFMETGLSYKELMRKYHCSERTVKLLLNECAEGDERIQQELDLRSRVP